MKKVSIISVLSLSALLIGSCHNVQRKPGLNYMPDMYKSRAYETYEDHSNLAANNIHYNNQPVAGTVSRGEELPYHLKNDSVGYAMSASVPNPVTKLSAADALETERLYLINCAICHGSKLDGNGPLYKGGDGPYPAKPATLVGDPAIEAKTEGTYFHVQTYGKGVMGSYASQLNRRQRWMIAAYIKSKQAQAKGATGGAAASGDTTKAAAAGSAKAGAATPGAGQ
jgi:mono/diheme cytochrome c family protein